MSDFRIFGFASTGNDVLIDVEAVSEVQQVYRVHGEPEQATFYMKDGRKVDLCDFWESTVARLQHGDDSPQYKAVIARLKREATKEKREAGEHRQKPPALGWPRRS